MTNVAWYWNVSLSLIWSLQYHCQYIVTNCLTTECVITAGASWLQAFHFVGDNSWILCVHDKYLVLPVSYLVDSNNLCNYWSWNLRDSALEDVYWFMYEFQLVCSMNDHEKHERNKFGGTSKEPRLNKSSTRWLLHTVMHHTFFLLFQSDYERM